MRSLVAFSLLALLALGCERTTLIVAEDGGPVLDATAQDGGADVGPMPEPVGGSECDQQDDCDACFQCAQGPRGLRGSRGAVQRSAGLRRARGLPERLWSGRSMRPRLRQRAPEQHLDPVRVLHVCVLRCVPGRLSVGASLVLGPTVLSEAR